MSRKLLTLITTCRITIPTDRLIPFPTTRANNINTFNKFYHIRFEWLYSLRIFHSLFIQKINETGTGFVNITKMKKEDVYTEVIK